MKHPMSFQSNRILIVFAFSLALACSALTAETVTAWSINTHLFEAEIALRDAQDGMVNIPPFGDFAVDPDALRALRNWPAVYRAGVIGPDLFPDIYMGQSFAHVDHSRDPSGSVSDDWMRLVFTEARRYKTPGQDRDGAMAFAYGYLTHAAGDMFGHTYVNGYAGGVWDWKQPGIVERHVVLEGYIGKRTPPSNQTIDSYERFISDSLIKHPDVLQRAGGALHYQTFLTLYRWLNASILRVQRQIEDSDPVTAELLRPKKRFLEGWRDDVDRGLRHLVEANQNIGIAVLANHPQDAWRAFGDWRSEWVPKMLGLHFAGEF